MNESTVKYPEVQVTLVGTDGNAFALLGKCRSAAKKAGLTTDQIKEFIDEATSGDYNHLLGTCMDYFEVD
jgi:protein-disulfide isomerase